MDQPTYDELRARYASMRTDALVQLAMAGHLTREAHAALQAELAARRSELESARPGAYLPAPGKPHTIPESLLIHLMLVGFAGLTAAASALWQWLGR